MNYPLIVLLILCFAPSVAMLVTKLVVVEVVHAVEVYVANIAAEGFFL